MFFYYAYAIGCQFIYIWYFEYLNLLQKQWQVYKKICLPLMHSGRYILTLLVLENKIHLVYETSWVYGIQTCSTHMGNIWTMPGQPNLACLQHSTLQVSGKTLDNTVEFIYLLYSVTVFFLKNKSQTKYIQNSIWLFIVHEVSQFGRQLLYLW
jgi:hypothetical protein